MPLRKKIEQYTETTRNTKIKCKECRSELLIINESKEIVKKTKLDNTVFTDKECCDYLIRTGKKSFFIELKGTDIKKALSQLKSTLITLRPYISEHPKKTCILVHTRHPQMDSGIQRATIALQRLGAKLEKGRSPMTHTLS